MPDDDQDESDSIDQDESDSLDQEILDRRARLRADLEEDMNVWARDILQSFRSDNEDVGRPDPPRIESELTQFDSVPPKTIIQDDMFPPPPQPAGTPAACCLYPGPLEPDATTFFYPNTDLPDSLVFTVLDGPYAGTYNFNRVSGQYYYSGADSSDIETDVLIFGDALVGEWQVNGGGTIGVGDSGPCLIVTSALIGTSHVTIADAFSTTYTVNGTDTITRATTCTWTGAGWTLAYDSAAYVWKLNGVTKTDPQSSPDGTYGTNIVA